MGTTTSSPAKDKRTQRLELLLTTGERVCSLSLPQVDGWEKIQNITMQTHPMSTIGFQITPHTKTTEKHDLSSRENTINSDSSLDNQDIGMIGQGL